MTDEGNPEERGWPPAGPPAPGPPAPGPPAGPPAPGPPAGGWYPPPPSAPGPPPPPPGPPYQPPAEGWGSPPPYQPPYQPPGIPPGQGWSTPPPYPPTGSYPPGGSYPPPYPPSYGPGYGIGPGQETEKLSIVSLVLGLLSFVALPVIAAIAAIITGTRAKRAVRESGGAKSGHGMATAGQALGWANIVVTILAVIAVAIGVSYFSHHKSYTTLQAGDCFNRGTGGGLSSLVTTVPCGKPHEDEAVGTFDLSSDSIVWPGPDGFRVAVGSQCADAAQAYIGQAASGGLRLVFEYPDKRSWDNGTRKIVCAVRNADGTKRTGTVRSLGPSTNG